MTTDHDGRAEAPPPPPGLDRGAQSHVTVDLRYAGSCSHPEGMVVRGASWRPATFPAMFAVLRHERHGVTLFDTGYSARFLDATRPLPERVYRWLTPMSLAEGDTAVSQLAAMGVAPGDVQRVILSHFHADHIAGARDFPEARFIATQEAYAAVTRPGPIGRLRRGFLPGLLPHDFGARADLLGPADFRTKGIASLGAGHDLFGDGSVLLVPLPGHAAGQVGALVRGPGGERHFLVADAAWTTAALREHRGPHPAAGLITDSAAVGARTLALLHELALTDPSLDIVPSHCAARAAAEARSRSAGG